jgi:quercetin dioxygenase-like cupin family protein
MCHGRYNLPMNSKLIFSLVASSVLLSVIAADRAKKSPIIHLDHQKVDAAFVKGGPLLATNNFKVLAGRRTGPGEVEIHEHDTDIFYILEGSATFITGGKVVDQRPSGEGEMRAKELVGGEDHQLNKGDVIVIPKGIPHWFKEVNGTFLYYMVKVSK